jgi:hypothetical protein
MRPTPCGRRQCLLERAFGDVVCSDCAPGLGVLDVAVLQPLPAQVGPVHTRLQDFIRRFVAHCDTLPAATKATALVRHSPLLFLF